MTCHIVYVDFDVKFFSTSLLTLHKGEYWSWLPVNENLEIIALESFYNTFMSIYTVANIWKMVDDLNNIILASIIKGDITAVFIKERAAMVRIEFYFDRIELIYVKDKIMCTKKENWQNANL